MMPKPCALNEDSKVMDEAKFWPKSYRRKDPKFLQSLRCWHRVYVDGHGGGGSLGGESYEGAIGGYLFVCPSTGEKHHKLHAHHEQFSVALFQFFVHVEGEGNHYREIYVGTFSINISAEAEGSCRVFSCQGCSGKCWESSGGFFCRNDASGGGWAVPSNVARLASSTKMVLGFG